MKAFIERVCILFQIIGYGWCIFLLYNQLFRMGVGVGNDLLSLLFFSVLIPNVLRWVLTGKFQMLPITSDD